MSAQRVHLCEIVLQFTLPEGASELSSEQARKLGEVVAETAGEALKRFKAVRPDGDVGLIFDDEQGLPEAWISPT